MRRLAIIAFLLLFAAGCGGTSELDYRLANDSYRCEEFDTTKEEMLNLINRARASSRNCGYKIFTSAGRLTWNPTLARAAFAHSTDMATNDFVSHEDGEGKDVSDRVEMVDYDWSTVAENISAGRESSAEVVSAWLDSPVHCENIMNPKVTEIGAACFHNKDTKYKTFWTVVLASPKE